MGVLVKTTCPGTVGAACVGAVRGCGAVECGEWAEGTHAFVTIPWIDGLRTGEPKPDLQLGSADLEPHPRQYGCRRRVFRHVRPHGGAGPLLCGPLCTLPQAKCSGASVAKQYAWAVQRKTRPDRPLRLQSPHTGLRCGRSPVGRARSTQPAGKAGGGPQRRPRGRVFRPAWAPAYAACEGAGPPAHAIGNPPSPSRGLCRAEPEASTLRRPLVGCPQSAGPDLRRVRLR